MKRTILSMAMGMAMALGAVLTAAPVVAEELSSLRGGTSIPEAKAPPPVYKLKLDQEKFERNFKSQPPLIPHKVAKYRINLKANRCLRCHDKATYKEEESPMTGKSHYIGADGKEMQTIHMGRYFCTQCHVPQVDAKPLVDNTFAQAK